MNKEQAQKRALQSAKNAWKEHQSYSSNRDVEDFSYPYQIGYLAAYNDLAPKIAKLVEVLGFYAQGGNFQTDVWEHESLGYFTGKRARETLKQWKEGE